MTTTGIRQGPALATPGRRSLLRDTLVGVAGIALGVPLSGCGDGSGQPSTGITIGTPRAATPAEISATPVVASPTGSKVLLAYFSRAGENYSYGGRAQRATGNTEILAGMIARLITCDVDRVEATEPYPDDDEETVARNVREQQADARPAIASAPLAIDDYDTVLLGSPIGNSECYVGAISWNVHAARPGLGRAACGGVGVTWR